MRVAETQPPLSLSDIYGPGVAFVPRPHPDLSTWLPKNPATQDAMTSGQLVIGGDIDYVCSACVAPDAGLALLRELGHSLPARIHAPDSEAAYFERVRSLAASGLRIVATHALPEDTLAPEAYWICRDTLAFLNNKAHLAELVPAEFVPERRIVPAARLAEYCGPDSLPRIVKAVTDEDSGGGVGVKVCRTIEDVGGAKSYFAACENVVIEAWLEHDRSFCLHYAILHDDAGIRYLGAAEQVIDEDGNFRGNWLDVNSSPPPAAIEAGLAAAHAGASRGYFGILGVDALVLPDGQARLVDLNFRANASTAGVLLADGIRARFGAGLGRLRRLAGIGDFDALLAAVRTAVAREWLLPFSFSDPRAGGHKDGSPSVAGIVWVESKEELDERERELEALGLN